MWPFKAECYSIITLLTNERTNQPTPWSRVLPEKRTGPQAIQEFPGILWNPKVHYHIHKRSPPLSILHQRHPDYASPPHFLKIHFDIIFPFTPRSSKWSLSIRSPHQNPVGTFSVPHTCHMPSPSHCIIKLFNT